MLEYVARLKQRWIGGNPGTPQTESSGTKMFTWGLPFLDCSPVQRVLIVCVVPSLLWMLVSWICTFLIWDQQVTFHPSFFKPPIFQIWIEVCSSFVLHCYICDSCLYLNLCDLKVVLLLVLLVFFGHCGDAGWGQARCLAVAAAGSADQRAAARTGESGGDAAQVGWDAGFTAGVDPACQASGTNHWRRGHGAHALNLSFQEVGQHLAFALHADFSSAHQVIVCVQQAIDLFSHLHFRKK